MRMRNSQPDEDVDTAFDFLDNYAIKDEEVSPVLLSITITRIAFFYQGR